MYWSIPSRNVLRLKFYGNGPIIIYGGVFRGVFIKLVLYQPHGSTDHSLASLLEYIISSSKRIPPDTRMVICSGIDVE